MTTNDNATDDATNSSNESTSGRYGSFTTDGDVVVYDRENETRWIQSDAAVSLAEVR
jgi:hypothetical protein